MFPILPVRVDNNAVHPYMGAHRTILRNELLLCL